MPYLSKVKSVVGLTQHCFFVFSRTKRFSFLNCQFVFTIGMYGALPLWVVSFFLLLIWLPEILCSITISVVVQKREQVYTGGQSLPNSSQSNFPPYILRLESADSSKKGLSAALFIRMGEEVLFLPHL